MQEPNTLSPTQVFEFTKRQTEPEPMVDKDDGPRPKNKVGKNWYAQTFGAKRKGRRR